MMAARAERLAEAVFFQNCQAFQHWVFAELPVAFDLRHRVAANSQESTFFCSCPRFPKPCVHATAFAGWLQHADPDKFEPATQLPAWVSALASGKPSVLPDLDAVAEQRNIQQTKRYLARLERAQNGFQDLEMWLLDTLRRGLATAISEDPDFYQNIAARLADASMRGLSREFRLLDAQASEQPDWAEQSAIALADAALALHAFRLRDLLPEALVYDLEACIGIPQKKELVRAQGESVRDVWLTVGSVEAPVEAALRLRRTWLMGQQSQRFALLLDYAHGGLDFQPVFLPGAVLEGELIFYPSAFPLRALIAEALTASSRTPEEMPGYEHLESMATAYAAALGLQPWLAEFPVVLHQAVPYREKNQFRLADRTGKSLPLTNTGSAGWALLAVSAGRPISVFGAWNGSRLHVLSILTTERLISIENPDS